MHTLRVQYVVLGIALILLSVLVLIVEGVVNVGSLPVISASDFAMGYLAAGDFSAGVFAAGVFAVGIFAAGVFAIGIFTIGIFSIGVFSAGTFAFGVFFISQVNHRNERRGRVSLRYEESQT